MSTDNRLVALLAVEEGSGEKIVTVESYPLVSKKAEHAYSRTHACCGWVRTRGDCEGSGRGVTCRWQCTCGGARDDRATLRPSST